MKKFIKKEYFIICFLLISTIAYSLVEYRYDLRIDKYLKEKSKETYLNYKIVYTNQKKLADLIFSTYINKKEVINLFKNKDRKSLENYLKEDYNKFRKFSIRQLHFHLPNNDSFLRMHRPEKYGDNLTKDRTTVRYVNENKKFIDGFEEGKIFNGFRFVYPLFDGYTHIGSVEVSFNALFFIKEMMKSYNTNIYFYIDKYIVDEKVFSDEKTNYIKSPFDYFYMQKSIYEDLKKHYTIKDYSKEFKNSVFQKIQTENIFSLYIKEYKTVSTFIPIQNPVTLRTVAFLQVNSLDETISEFCRAKYLYTGVLIILIGIILTLIYKQLLFHSLLNKNIESKTEKYKNMNLHLEKMLQKEIAKTKQKNQVIVSQSRDAAMGEMISTISHQWREPISAIAMDANNIILDMELGLENEDNIEKKCKEIIDQTDYLTKTIDEFRNFFDLNKELESVSIDALFEKTLSIMNKSLKNNNIEVLIESSYQKNINTYSKELSQVLINLLKNAKDAVKENDEGNRKIILRSYEHKSKLFIEIEDMGDGINIDLKDKVFEPFFSTKEQKKVGLGLYISKIIVEDYLKGVIRFLNVPKGVVFVLELPLDLSKRDEYV